MASLNLVSPEFPTYVNGPEWICPESGVVAAAAGVVPASAGLKSFTIFGVVFCFATHLIWLSICRNTSQNDPIWCQRPRRPKSVRKNRIFVFFQHAELRWRSDCSYPQGLKPSIGTYLPIGKNRLILTWLPQDRWTNSCKWNTWRGDCPHLNLFRSCQSRCRSLYRLSSPVPTAIRVCSPSCRAETCSYLKKQ